MAAPVPSSISGRALRARQRRALHRKRELLLQQAVITVLGAAAEERKGTRAGTKTVPRKRADLDGIMRGLGGYVRKAYRTVIAAHRLVKMTSGAKLKNCMTKKEAMSTLKVLHYYQYIITEGTRHIESRRCLLRFKQQRLHFQNVRRGIRSRESHPPRNVKSP